MLIPCSLHNGNSPVYYLGVLIDQFIEILVSLLNSGAHSYFDQCLSSHIGTKYLDIYQGRGANLSTRYEASLAAYMNLTSCHNLTVHNRTCFDISVGLNRGVLNKFGNHITVSSKHALAHTVHSPGYGNITARYYRGALYNTSYLNITLGPNCVIGIDVSVNLDIALIFYITRCGIYILNLHEVAYEYSSVN